MSARSFYRGYLLSCQPTQHGERYRARVAITSIAGDKTRWQRFLDLEMFASAEAAEARAREAGMAWVDAHEKHDRESPERG